MVKAINFDMDGTLCDFYGVDNWLAYLVNKDAYPYKVAEPRLNMSILARYLNVLQREGYEINIISWLAKNSDDEFDKKVTKAKEKWLKKHLPSVKWNKITIVPYGVNKSTLGEGILFDDEEPNRNMWGEGAYDVHDIMSVLKGIAWKGE